MCVCVRGGGGGRGVEVWAEGRVGQSLQFLLEGVDKVCYRSGHTKEGHFLAYPECP